MSANTKQKPIHSFSTNFFGVLGYINIVFVWLLVLTCILAFVPIEVINRDLSMSSPSHDGPLKMLLIAMLIPLTWAFCYNTSSIFSRIIRRCMFMFDIKVTAENLVMAKYYLIAVGLLMLAVLVMISPVGSNVQMALASLGFLGGVNGVATIAIQQHLMGRHKVPAARVL